MVEFFLGLIAGIALSALFVFLAGKRRMNERAASAMERKERHGGVERAAEAPVRIPSAVPDADRERFVAAIAASIAAYLGTDVSGLRIRSIRRISGVDVNRGRFVAAVSAALAMAMGTEPQGLRIRSIRRIPEKDANRNQLVAAMSAAIATAMGADVSAIRIHSIKRITV